MPAGELRERLRFEKRVTQADDGYGNREGDWQAQFEEIARVRMLTGSEPVIAARMAGVQPVRITVYSSYRTRLITSGWRAVDTRNEARMFAITAPPANLDEKNRFLDIMAQSGVPT